jgi:CubicO group peptidase (beta-lactamase class C family)
LGTGSAGECEEEEEEMKTVRRLVRFASSSFALLFAGGLIAVVAVAAFASAPGGADAGDGDRFDQIDRYVRGEMDSSRIPGIAIAVVEDGRIVHSQGFGDDGNGHPITPQTPFWIGSNTKSFTALAAMQLADAGTLDLEEPVRRYLPSFRTADEQASAQITVRHLMNQTSGFSRADGIELALEEPSESLEEVVASLGETELNRPVGESFEYSNVNFVVLGLIVETVSGQAWSEYIQEHVLAPLGMDHTFTSLQEARANGLTEMHRFWFGLPVETEVKYARGLAPTGYIYSTAEDMARYLAMYLDGGRGGESRVLSEEGISAMLAGETNVTTRPLLGHVFEFRYGRGWFVGPFGAADHARWHLGDREMFNAWMVLLPETQQAVVILTNANSFFDVAGANEVMSRIPRGVVNILRGEEPPAGLALTRFYIIFDAAVLIALAVQVWSLIRVAGAAGRPVPREVRGLLGKIATFAPFIWEFGLSLALLVLWPQVSGGWKAAFMSLPDLSLVLVAVASFWLLTGVVRAAGLARAYASARRAGVASAARSFAPSAR